MAEACVAVKSALRELIFFETQKVITRRAVPNGRNYEDLVAFGPSAEKIVVWREIDQPNYSGLCTSSMKATDFKDGQNICHKDEHGVWMHNAKVSECHPLCTLS